MPARSLAALVFLLTVAAGSARAKPPTLTALNPPGSRQGTTVLVTASGTFERWPVRGWCDADGVTVDAAPDKGKFWVTVVEGVREGTHWVRVFDDEGASALRPFVVGSLPELNEVEPNDDPSKAHPIDVAAVTVNGKLGRNGDVDGFAVRLERGETLVASMEANRRLGSPMDGLLQVARTDGIVLAENDDVHGRDPQIVFQAPASGTYVVRTFAFPATPDSKIGFSGGETFLYRLTLTTRGFIDHPYPLAVTRGKTLEVLAEGWNIGDDARTLRVEPLDRTLGVASHPKLGNVSEVQLVDHASAVEAEPNSLEAPQEITPPLSLTGRLDSRSDVDAFRFPAKKDQRLLLRVASRALGQPLDPTLRVIDATGKVVTEADDSNNGRDAELTFMPPADGDYRVIVGDLNRQGGPQAVYLLTVAAPVPDVRLRLAADRFALVPGKPLSLPVTIERTNGFDQAIELTAVGLPECVSVKPAKSEAKGETAKAVTLMIEAKPGEPTWSGPFQVVGRIEGDPVGERTAEAKVDALEATTRQVWLTVGKAAEAKAAETPARKKN
jgi:hypothetical protein